MLMGDLSIFKCGQPNDTEGEALYGLNKLYLQVIYISNSQSSTDFKNAEVQNE